MVSRHWRNERKGGDPRTDQVTKGADSKLPGWHPEETDQRGWRLCAQEAGAKNPSVRRGGGPKDPGVAAPLAAAGCRNFWRVYDCSFFLASSSSLLPLVFRRNISRVCSHLVFAAATWNCSYSGSTPQMWIARCTSLWQGNTWNQLSTRVPGYPLNFCAHGSGEVFVPCKANGSLDVFAVMSEQTT